MPLDILGKLWYCVVLIRGTKHEPKKELWYGNVIPQEYGIFNKPQFKELLGYTARHRSELEETLTDKQKKLPRKMMDN